jgi:3-hydroxybutyryl-CoA dehydrogenase
MNNRYHSIAVIGEGSLIPEISQCLIQAGHHVIEYDRNLERGEFPTLSELVHNPLDNSKVSRVETLSHLEVLREVGLIILITPENLKKKQDYLSEIELYISAETPVCVNTESFSLHEIRDGRDFPERILGLNWVRPAQTTLFAELIVLPDTPYSLVESLESLMKDRWRKDPYVIHQGKSIRSKLMAAMIREAFFLLDNGYVDVADIDRACRNDAGYYLPFAGNFRYMDLMGTYLYGVVMEDLNKELSTSQELPEFFRDILRRTPNAGLKAGEGFYKYAAGDREKLEAEFLDFGKKIRQLMDKYPFPSEHVFENPSDMKESTPFVQENRSLRSKN